MSFIHRNKKGLRLIVKRKKLKYAVLVFLPLFSIFSGCDAIINTLSFFPNTSDTLCFPDSLPPGIKLVTIETGDHEKLACLLLRSANSGRLLIYFHGNAGNIDVRLPELEKIRDLGVNVLGVSYRGYGRSTGSASEEGIYSDGQAAYRFAADSLGYTGENIIILGRSIGTTVAMNTAQKRDVAKVILVTPLTDGCEFARARHLGFLSFLVKNRFDNLGKCRYIRAPILIIHGTEDEIIPYALGVRLYDSIHGKKKFVSIPKGRHNDLEMVDPHAYWGSIKEFIATQENE